MSDETWRPLGVDTDDDIAEYDALHDGVPPWMRAAYWAWVRSAITDRRNTAGGLYGSGHVVDTLDIELTEQMCQALRITLPNLRRDYVSFDGGKAQLDGAMEVLARHAVPLQIADFLLANGGRARAEQLNELLARSKSAWEVGTRAGRPGLVRRVPIGVQVAADSIMGRAGRAGVRLAKAWEELYGIAPDPSSAYGLSIKAVEDAAIPVVSPANKNATLGTVLKQIEDQGDWQLPMTREHDRAPSHEVLVGMMRLLWHGQHDRHGGQPSAPGDVSMEEATVAVSMAVVLVNWFDSGVVSREKP